MRAAHELAALTGQTLTDAVEDALEARLRLVRASRTDPTLAAARSADNLAWLAAVRQDGRAVSDDELYGEDGLPR